MVGLQLGIQIKVIDVILLIVTATIMYGLFKWAKFNFFNK